MRFKILLASLCAVLTIAGVVITPAAGAAADWPVSRYRHMVTTGWCLDGDRGRAYAGYCNGGENQLWHYSHGTTNLMLRNHLTRGCLDGNGNVAYISVCGDGNVFQRWDAVGVNGHVIFRHRKTNTCIQPYVVWESLRLVPCTYWNVQAWDYFR